MLENFTVELAFNFMLIFARLGTAFAYFPAIGSHYIFVRARLIFALFVSIIIAPMVIPYLPKYSSSFALNIGYLAIEMLIGVIISLAANIYFQTIHFVGQILSLQSSLGTAAFFDPTQRLQVTLFSNFMILITIVFIFASDVHYLFIKTVVESYAKFPPGELIDAGDISKFVSFVINDSFILSFKISSPFLIVSLAILTGSGILSRLMPNLQVFFVITPAQILVMFIILYIVINAIITKIVTAITNGLSPLAF